MNKPELIDRVLLKLTLGGDAMTSDRNIERLRYSVLDVCRLVDALPTVDVAPVVHGEWVFKGTACRCSICGGGYPLSIFDNYCKDCGARMDGKER